MARRTTNPKPTTTARPTTRKATGRKTTARKRTPAKKPNYGKRAAIAGGKAAIALSTGTGLHAARKLGYRKHANVAAGMLATAGIVAQIAAEPGSVPAELLATAGNSAIASQLADEASTAILNAMGKGTKANTEGFDSDAFADDFEEFTQVPAHAGAGNKAAA